MAGGVINIRPAETVVERKVKVSWWNLLGLSQVAPKPSTGFHLGYCFWTLILGCKLVPLGRRGFKFSPPVSPTL